MTAEAGVTKSAVARNFSAAAGSYRSVNNLQQVVAGRLLERMEYMTLSPGRVLDMGSGPGTSAVLLQKTFPKTGIIEMDLSHGMLLESRRGDRRFFRRRSRVCGDAEQTALRTSSVDIVFSSLMLQWCNDPDSVFTEVARILKPNGLFIFSSFGPDTLKELRESWRAVDEGEHVNTFLDMHDVGDGLMRCGFQNPVLESEYIDYRYNEAHGLMRDLKQLGAQNSNRERRKSLTGKKRMQSMLCEYEKYRHEGKLPVTYEIVYGHAWKAPLELAKKSGENVATFSLEALKGSVPRK